MNTEGLSWWLTPEQDRALYRELLPVRPSATLHDPDDGPSFLLMQLEREQKVVDNTGDARVDAVGIRLKAAHETATVAGMENVA